MRNQVKIEGAGKYGGYRGDTLSASQAENVARSISGGRIGSKAITFEGWRDHLPEYLDTKTVLKKLQKPNLQTWEDRNRANKGTKLNP